MTAMTLWGDDGSTHVRTVKMVFAEKGFTDYEQIALDGADGEPEAPAARERHPFGEVPVLQYDGLRIVETSAIARYLDDVLRGKLLTPSAAANRARMNMTIGLVDSYGYDALVGGVAAFHLFPEFVGGRNDAAREAGLENGRRVLEYVMQLKDSAPFIAGDLSLADLYLAPILAYVALTPDAAMLLRVPGFGEWWERVQSLASFRETALG